MARIENVCTDDTPSSSSIVLACRQVDQMARRLAPTERIVEWSDNELGGH